MIVWGGWVFLFKKHINLLCGFVFEFSPWPKKLSIILVPLKNHNKEKNFLLFRYPLLIECQHYQKLLKSCPNLAVEEAGPKPLKRFGSCLGGIKLFCKGLIRGSLIFPSAPK